MTDFHSIPAFGVAGNFTGHLEQAGEAVDFTRVQAAKNAPKGIFPTFIPLKKNAHITPDFLTVFPFDENKIIFPSGEEKIQIEPECALLCTVVWGNKGNESGGAFNSSDKKEILDLQPLYFGASNDCSIRKAGAPKISFKKNWGEASKGFAHSSLLKIDSFNKNGLINDYRIASFLIREGKVFDYGEDSAIRDYSYIYEQLIDWCIEKLNSQKDEGPLEMLHSYLGEADFPQQIMISIGATRYTEFGETNFLKAGDKTAVILYPESKYSHIDIKNKLINNENFNKDISVLIQEIVLK